MNTQDRNRLVQLKFSPEVIARTEQVLDLWEMPNLFAICSSCKKPCYNPDLPRGKRLRKKLPAELWWRYELRSVRNKLGEVVCWPCDDFEWEYG